MVKYEMGFPSNIIFTQIGCQYAQKKLNKTKLKKKRKKEKTGHYTKRISLHIQYTNTQTLFTLITFQHKYILHIKPLNNNKATSDKYRISSPKLP